MPTRTDIVAASRRRSSFSGRNDKYLTSRRSRLTLGDTGFIPGLELVDVADNTYFDDDYKHSATERLSRYKHYYDFYDGEHWVYPWDEGERKPVHNYCKLIVDTHAAYYAGRNIAVEAPEGYEDLADALNQVWASNRLPTYHSHLANLTGITGDVYGLVTVKSKDATGQSLPKESWKVQLQIIEPQYVFPVFDDAEFGRLKACLIQIPMGIKPLGSPMSVWSMYVSDTEIIEYNDGTEISRMPNPFGKVNLVHFPDSLQHGTNFGLSQLKEVIPLNEDYNTTMNSIKKIIKYHGEPTTVIYGAKASELERGAKSVWSGLPEKAKVENLTLESDLSSLYSYLEKVEGMVCRASKTPKQAWGIDQGISNTSGIALEITLNPVLHSAKRRRTLWKTPFAQMHELIAIAESSIIGSGFDALYDDPEVFQEIRFKHEELLPVDETAETDRAVKRIEAGLSSKAEEFRRLHTKNGRQRLVMEIIQDMMSSLAIETQKNRSLNGESPNLQAAFLGSIASSQDISELQKLVSSLHKQFESKKLKNEPISTENDEK